MKILPLIAGLAVGVVLMLAYRRASRESPLLSFGVVCLGLAALIFGALAFGAFE